MVDAPEIKVKLTAEDAGVAAAIKELGSQLKNLKTQEVATTASSLNLSTALKGIAFSAVAYSVAAFAKSVFDAGTQVARTAQITGASAQTIGVFHKAAGDLGVDAEVVDKSFVRLSRSILNFQTGNIQTVAAFKQLGISAKDFVGLNTDQKIKLVTDRLGGMAEGTNRAALAQQLLGRGGAAALPVLQQLAGSGFAEVEAEARKMGILLDNQTAQSMLTMKESMEDLKSEAEGAATQFEVGLIPAITDVSSAIVQVINGGAGGGFKALGEGVGSLVEKVAYGLVTTGQRVAESIAIMETAWDFAISHMKGSAIVLGEALTGNITGAFAKMKELGLTNAGKDFAAQIGAIEKQFKDENDKANLDIFGGASNPTPPKRSAGKEGSGSLPVKATSDTAQKAAASQFEKYLQDELALVRANAKQTEEIEKEKYDQGEISLQEYFDHRRAEVTTDAAEESRITQREITAQIDAAEKAAVAARHATTDKDKDKQNAAKIEALTKVMDLQTKLQESEIAASTKITALNMEQSKAVDELQKKRLTFENELLVAQGKTFEAARQKIIAEGKEMQDPRALASSGTSAAEVQKLTDTRLQTLAFEQQQKSEQDALQENSDKRDEVLNRVKDGQIFEAKGERDIKKIEQDRLVILQQIAQQLSARAEVTGSDADKAAAAGAAKNVDTQKTNIDVTGQNIKKLRESVDSGLTNSFTNFFETVGRGTQTVARSFENLAASIVGSIEKVIVQMLVELAVKKLLAAVGFSGGGLVPGVGLAGGGLIKGTGGPTADSIPARLSAGEFVVKASAVSAIGAHNLEAINRGMQPLSIGEINRSLPKFADGGLVAPDGGSGSSSSINLGIGLDQGLILHHLSSKDAGRIILQHLTNNPKAAGKALGRSQT
jgi:hypothetical protein